MIISACKKIPIIAFCSQWKMLIYNNKLRLFITSQALFLAFSYQTLSFRAKTTYCFLLFGSSDLLLTGFFVFYSNKQMFTSIMLVKCKWHDKIKKALRFCKALTIRVYRTRIELARPFEHMPLKHARLPISPSGQNTAKL